MTSQNDPIETEVAARLTAYESALVEAAQGPRDRKVSMMTLSPAGFAVLEQKLNLLLRAHFRNEILAEGKDRS